MGPFSVIISLWYPHGTSLAPLGTLCAIIAQLLGSYRGAESFTAEYMSIFRYPRTLFRLSYPLIITLGCLWILIRLLSTTFTFVPSLKVFLGLWTFESTNMVSYGLPLVKNWSKIEIFWEKS